MKIKQLIDWLSKFDMEANVEIENKHFECFYIDNIYIDTTRIVNDKFPVHILMGNKNKN